MFYLQKEGNSVEEYEDAYSPKCGVDKDAQEFRFALADGAAESSFPAIWAKLLVRGFCRRRFDPPQLSGSLVPLQKNWERFVRRRPLAWYAEELFERGGFSTFLGLTLSQSDRAEALVTCGSWHCVAIGDSCLFHIRRSELLRSFPKTKSEEFNNRPYLLSSNPANNGRIGEHLRECRDEWQQDDSFFLMTDALASWFLHSSERGERPWELLSELETRDEKKTFSQLVADLRATKVLRNDDTTLVRINVD